MTAVIATGRNDVASAYPASEDPSDRLKRVEQLRAAVTAATADASSPDRSVSVTVAAGGAVTAIRLTALAMGYDNRALGPLIVDTIRNAATQVQESLVARAAELSGGAGGFSAVLRGELAPPPVLEDVEPVEGVIDDVQPTFALPPGYPVLDDIEETLDNLRAEAKAQHARYDEVRERFATLTATGTSFDGLVTATLRPGAVIAVDIDPAAMRHGPGILGHLVLSAIQMASARLAGAMAEMAQPLAGPRLDLVALIREHAPADVDPTGGGRD
jgi:DNA-binding protein YbaB